MRSFSCSIWCYIIVNIYQKENLHIVKIYPYFGLVPACPHIAIFYKLLSNEIVIFLNKHKMNIILTVNWIIFRRAKFINSNFLSLGLMKYLSDYFYWLLLIYFNMTSPALFIIRLRMKKIILQKRIKLDDFSFWKRWLIQLKVFLFFLKHPSILFNELRY